MANQNNSQKQKLFVQEYLVDLNATQAAIRAGYSEATAYSQGQRLLKNVEIANMIDEAMKERGDRTQVTADMVIAELAKVAFHNVQDFVNGGNSILELKHLDREKVAAVSAVKTTMKADGDLVSEVKFHDKIAALEKLGRHLGIFEKDNTQRKQESIIIPDKVSKAIDKLLDDAI
jgi:phage terminase small subunit